MTTETERKALADRLVRHASEVENVYSSLALDLLDAAAALLSSPPPPSPHSFTAEEIEAAHNIYCPPFDTREKP